MEETLKQVVIPFPGLAQPLQEVLVGLMMLTAVIMVHGVLLRIVNWHFMRYWARVTVNTPRWSLNLALSVVVGLLAAIHLTETLIFTVPIVRLEIIPNGRDAYYYVLESYTTLGDGTISLPDDWRLLGPIIAMTGLFTFGWTGSMLVSILTQYSHIDRVQVKKIQDDEDRGKARAAGLAEDQDGPPA